MVLDLRSLLPSFRGYECKSILSLSSGVVYNSVQLFFIQSKGEDNVKAKDIKYYS